MVDKLTFFSMDNCDKKMNKRYIVALKRAENVAAEELISDKFRSAVPVSWIYFADYLIEDYNYFVFFETIFEKGRETG